MYYCIHKSSLDDYLWYKKSKENYISLVIVAWFNLSIIVTDESLGKMQQMREQERPPTPLVVQGTREKQGMSTGLTNQLHQTAEAVCSASSGSPRPCLTSCSNGGRRHFSVWSEFEGFLTAN